MHACHAPLPLCSEAADASPGCDSPRPALMQVRQQMPSGFIGLWPEVPLLAHSCIPNTAMTVVGDRLLVHAVRPEGRAQGGGQGTGHCCTL